MHHLIPPLLATSLILAIICLSLGAFQYWDRNPEKAQALAARVMLPVWEAIKLASRIVIWPVTLVIAIVRVTVMFVGWYFAALAWVLLTRVAGEPASFKLKLS